jgi:hypothetical protein
MKTFWFRLFVNYLLSRENMYRLQSKEPLLGCSAQVRGEEKPTARQHGWTGWRKL